MTGDAKAFLASKVWAEVNFFQFWEELEGILLLLDTVLQGLVPSLDTALVSYANNEPIILVGSECCISTLELALVLLAYDALVFDCPPGIEHLERLGVVAADVALVCTNAHPLALVGARRVLNELKQRQQKGRRGAQRWAVVLTMIDLRRSMDQALDKQVAESYPTIKRLTVHQDTAISWAGAERVPIMQYEPNSKGAKDLQAIVEWMLNG